MVKYLLGGIFYFLKGFPVLYSTFMRLYVEQVLETYQWKSNIMYRFLIHNFKKMVGEIAQKETNLCQNRSVDYKIKMRVANCDMKLQIQFSSFKKRSTRAISFVNKFKENGHIVTQNQDVTHHSLVVFKKITKGPPEQEFVYYCETVRKGDCPFLLRVEGTYRTRYQNLDLYVFVKFHNVACKIVGWN